MNCFYNNESPQIHARSLILITQLSSFIARKLRHLSAGCRKWRDMIYACYSTWKI